MIASRPASSKLGARSNHMEIKDKTALVTGSARGLGFAMIQELADRGAKCVVTDIDEAGVAEAVKKLQATGARARGIVCDV